MTRPLEDTRQPQVEMIDPAGIIETSASGHQPDAEAEAWHDTRHLDYTPRGFHRSPSSGYE